MRSRLIMYVVGLWAAYLCGLSPAIAQLSISVPDTVLQRGIVYEIPVSGKLNIGKINNFKAVFKYNSLMLDVKSIHGASELGIENDIIQISNLNNVWTDLEIEISADKIKDNFEGILFYIQAEALAAPDSVTLFSPLSLTIDGVLQTNTLFKAGRIIVPPPFVQKSNQDGIGLNYPNPFDGESSLKFTLEDSTSIEFDIFTSTGGLVCNLPEINDYVKFTVYDNSGKYVSFGTDKNILSKGTYELKLRPNRNFFSTGIYYIVMKTSRGTFKTNFVYVK